MAGGGERALEGRLEKSGCSGRECSEFDLFPLPGDVVASLLDGPGCLALRVEGGIGVVEMEGLKITGFSEKPVLRSHVNAGIYALTPDVLELLKPGEYCDMPTVFELLAKKGQEVVAYPMYEPWLDVGRPDDLKTAQTIPLKRARG